MQAGEKTVVIINGPFLNLLGTREPNIYGTETLADARDACQRLAAAADIKLEFHQTNSEGEIIDTIHQAIGVAAGIIINPAAFSHTSVAILDALTAFAAPVFEVHVSNIYQRESFRHFSYVSRRANGVIAGFGIQGYEFAMARLVRMIR